MKPLLLALLFAAPVLAPGWASGAISTHQHGVARLEINVEPHRVTFDLDTPLDNLLVSNAARAPTPNAIASKPH